jgi:two-component system, cell cycle response regulator
MSKFPIQSFDELAATSHPLASEYRQLSARLQELLEQANNNQRIMQRHHSLNLKLIGAGSLVELLDTIFLDLKDSSALDRLTLMVFDPEYEIQRMLDTLSIDIASYPNLLLQHAPSELDAAYLTLHKPELGTFTAIRHTVMFPGNLQAPASVAIMPLYRQRHLIGYLNFGSMNPARFVGNIATDFIEEQTSIVAICLENVINNERLKHIGLTDPLTGVNNRRYIETRLMEEIKRAQRQGYALSCMYIDIDHFKQINDTLGHQIGDQVLREVAARIKSELRLSDALGRFGGEEFLVLLIDTDDEGATNVAERIRASIANNAIHLNKGKTCNASVSIGLSTLAAEKSTRPPDVIAQDFVGQADLALYQAKSGGRNRIVTYVSSNPLICR